MSVTTLDFDTEYWNIVNNLREERTQRLAGPLVQLFDGNFVLRGRVTMSYTNSFQEINGDTGLGVIELPPEHYLAQWATNEDARATQNIFITVDKDGVRWSGAMDRYEIDKTDSWHVKVRLIFKHDYENLKHILCWANPFLPAAVQFPRIFLLFGPALWTLKTTLFCNILRLMFSDWQLPADPLNLANWTGDNPLDQSTWSMVVAPDDITTDTSLFSILVARFKDFHTVARSTMEDAELTPTFRRYLEGDPPPWEGANLKPGCLVIDIVNKSDWAATGGTSIGGDIFEGLQYAVASFLGEGYFDGTVPVADPAFPAEYSQPGWKSVIPGAPTVIYRDAGPQSGIVSSLFTGSPPKDVQHVTGGHSAPGVNEIIGSAIQMVGDLTAVIVGVPPIGGPLNTILAPLYTDVFLAFEQYYAANRATALSTEGFFLQERWADGSDMGYTVSAVLGLYESIWATRHTFTHKLTVQDGCPWIVGQNGYGNFYVGDRIGSTVQGTPPGKVYVDQVSEITLKWDRKTSPTWDITIGQRKYEDPVAHAFERIENLVSIVHDLGAF